MKPLPLARWMGILALFFVEVWSVTYQLRPGRLLQLPNSLWLDVAEQVPALMRVVVGALAAAIVFGWRGFREELRQRTHELRPGAPAWVCFFFHLVFFVTYLALTDWLLASETFVPGWTLIWAFMGLASFGLLGLTLLSAACWGHLVRRSWAACLAGLGVGALAFVGGQYTSSWWSAAEAMSWWQPLSQATLSLVRFVLELLSSDVIYERDRFLVGTSIFQVEIGAPCSGYEGIGLIWVLLGAYLGFCRRSLRFPQAFLLIPLGTLLIWLTNALRIAAFILIGTHWSPDVAERGFHSQAGWLAFNAVGLGLIAVSRYARFFRADDGESERVQRLNAAAPYLVPFLVLMAALMVCAAFTAGFDYLYPVKVLAVAAALTIFWRQYARWSWSWSWAAAGLGGLVFVVWLALEPMHAGPPDDQPVAIALDNMPSAVAAAWILFRILGSVVTVPLAEELAFRGFLIRRLQKTDFEEVPPRSFSWLSFLVSSVLFGLLHGRWLAGSLAGMIYALAVYRRGKLADGVLAHAVTNALIAAYVLLAGDWSLWS